MNPFQKVISAGLIIAVATAITVPASGEVSHRAIVADYTDVKGPRSEVWRECVGAGRAEEGLRADWQEQLKLCQDEIGFRFIRFHGLLTDDMGVYTETADGHSIHNWQYVDKLFDKLLDLKLHPFVEFGFTPSALASGSKKMFWWNGNVTPPRDYAKWDDLISGLVRHWEERYGTNEVREWLFEIWNEPNYPGFWGPRNPKRPKEEYFELYQHTAEAVKKVDSSLRVGGPAGAGPDWVFSLLAFCSTNPAPLNFISYHAYGLGDGPSGLDQFGNRFLYLSENLHSPADIAQSQRPVIDATSLKGLPIHITEWSSSYSPRDPMHDAYFSAPYILEQLKRTEHGIASMSYWVFTDIFEENGPPMTPFHGGFGLLNLQGIKKPAYFAYRFLNQLGVTELKNQDASSWVCRDDHGGVQLLVWDLSNPVKDKQSNQETFRKLQPSGVCSEVHVKLSHLAPGNYVKTVYRTGFEKNDAYSAYLKMGAPSQLSREQERSLKEASNGKADSEEEITIGNSGDFEQTLALRSNDVFLITLSRR